MINSAGVFIELIAAVLIAIILGRQHDSRSRRCSSPTNGYGAGESGGYLGAFLIASLASGYVMYGFDTASSLGEETVEPRRTAPKAIFRAILASFVIGGAHPGVRRDGRRPTSSDPAHRREHAAVCSTSSSR